MGAAVSGFVDALVNEEIRRTVAEAIEDGDVVLSSEAAAGILRLYKNTGLSEVEVADRIMMAAARAGVAVEFGRTAGSGPAGESGRSHGPQDAKKGRMRPLNRKARRV